MAGPAYSGPDGVAGDDGWTDEPDWAVTHLRSVGVDVGSATCHVVFSEITMAKQGQRFVPVRRQVTYTSPVLLTPYRDGTEIDADTVVSFVDQQFAAAGVDRAGTGAGAVILTGTALDRANARLVADLVADQAGVFVAVSAGDDMEAVLAAHGCGAVARSVASGRAVLAIDIGGGTTKIGLCENGEVAATAALDVGARLVAVDGDGRVVRLEAAAERVAQRLGMRLTVGDVLTDADRDTLAGHLVEQVLTAAGLRGRRHDSWLLRTAPLPDRTGSIAAADGAGERAGLSGTVEPMEVVVSGGVAEYLADPDAADVGDLGPSLARALRAAFGADPKLRVTVPDGAIRATVFGAALFTVQLSGDTILVTDPALLPLRNVPVVNLPPLPDVVDADAVARTVARNAAASAPDTPPGPPAVVAVGVHWTGSAVRDRLDALARGIAGGLGGSDGSGPVVLVCDGDVGRLLGRRVAALLGPRRSVVSVDGVDVRDLDYVDVGPPAGRSRAVPVTVKSLLFPNPDPLPVTESPPGPSHGRGRGTFASLRNYNYRLFFVGQGISVAGNWMQNVAIAWLVLQLTDNAVVLGAVTAARFAPLVLLGPWGGLITDRSDKRRLLTLTQAVAGVLAILLAVLWWIHAMSLVLLLCIVVALGLVNVFDNPARQSLINNLVHRDLLGNAVALNSISMNFSRIIGPAVGGALIATLGIGPCFFVNGLSFGAVIASLAAMRRSELYPSQRETRARGQVRAGLRYAMSTPAVWASLVMVAVAGTFAWEFPVTLPLLTVNTFHTGAAAYGVVMSCLGVGSIAGGLLAATRREFTVVSLAMSSLIWGVLIVLAAISPSMLILYLTIALVGSAAITFNSSAKTLLQLSSDATMRGRVMSLWSIAWQGSSVVGAPLVGLAADTLGARWSLAIGGISTVMAGAYYARKRPVVQSGLAPDD